MSASLPTTSGTVAALLVAFALGPAASADPSRSARIAKGERAAAAALKAGGLRRFRGVRAHGDVVCGEAAARPGLWTPFYAYPDDRRWMAHLAADGRPLAVGLRCFDRETRRAPEPAGRLSACKDYDFSFYFAYDHFCR